MDIRHLQYVLELARTNSFTKAAEALHITQPTLSKMIKNLEEELGIELFLRIGKRVELSEEGRAILGKAQDIVNSFHDLEREIHDLTHLQKGSIRIGLPPMAGSSFFPKVMQRFRDKYPGVTIHMVEDGSLKIEAEVASGHLDMGVVLLPTDAELFETYTIIKEQLKLVVHPSHPFADRKEVPLAELAEETFILFSEDFALHDRIITECVRAGFRPQVLYKSSQWDFIGEMVAANLGIALLPEPICRVLNPARVRILPLVHPTLPWHLAMIWRKQMYLSFAAREWIRLTQECFEEGLSPD
ncbi:LysR family transcriptional regulator [Paenibacillus rigui]|uniref:LysR family transcriptional regulator n=1 Tax=Paenibacillus rigui TaxID=554312 RepID=A0A229UU83_9BACL|nr:LysR family transcriptional regulator [Paenibacillus rigui]OXM86469.1 LysR family transcriptional regulator [Paenibacillus rigui]